MRSDWPAAQPVIGDELVILRGWLPQDAARVYDACQDAEIQYFTQVPVPYLREHAEHFVAQGPLEWSTGQSAGFAITERASGELLGACGLLGVDHATRETGAGYWVAPWARPGALRDERFGWSRPGRWVRADSSECSWKLKRRILPLLRWRSRPVSHLPTRRSNLPSSRGRPATS